MTGIRGKSRLAVFVVTAVAGGLVPAAAAATAAAAASHPAAASRPAADGASGDSVLVDCGNHHRVAPRRFVLSCADANDYLRHLTWVTWNSTALAAGTEWINDCTPDCAQGTFRHYRVVVVLWRPRPLPGSSSDYFTRLTTLYTHKRPVSGGKPVAQRTWQLWSHI